MLQSHPSLELLVKKSVPYLKSGLVSNVGGSSCLYHGTILESYIEHKKEISCEIYKHINKQITEDDPKI